MFDRKVDHLPAQGLPLPPELLLFALRLDPEQSSLSPVPLSFELPDLSTLFCR